MHIDVQKILKDFSLNAPASKESLASFVERFGPIRDKEYLEFMKAHDGGDGAIGDAKYLVIWSLADATASTDGYHADDYREGLLLFATDGGDTAYGFDRSTSNWQVLSVSLTSASPEDVHYCAGNFSKFLERVAREECLLLIWRQEINCRCDFCEGGHGENDTDG